MICEASSVCDHETFLLGVRDKKTGIWGFLLCSDMRFNIMLNGNKYEVGKENKKWSRGIREE